MLISNETESRFLKASDLKGRTVSANIDRVEEVELDGKVKHAMHFIGREMAMILNVTNKATLIDAFGNETDDWHGKPVEVFSARVNYQGEMRDGLRLRIPTPAGQALDDDIPW